MTWTKILIRASDVAGKSATSLVENFISACQASDISSSVHVYHGKLSNGDHVYYFSPEALSIIASLPEIGFLTHVESPDLSHCSKIRI